MNISKSNFIIISITMVTVLFLFQFSNISSIYTSKATDNSMTAQETKIKANQTVEVSNLVSDISYTTAIVGKEEKTETQISEEWCLYVKRTYCHYNTLAKFHANLSQHCKLLIVGADMVNTEEDIQILKNITNLGIHIIFTSMPDISLLEASETLRHILGIKTVISKNYTTNGTTFYEGFLLGGKATYHTLHKKAPYFSLTSGAKIYAVGEVKNQKKKQIANEDLPPVIWRTYYGNSFVFCVNSNFFEDHTGLGILTSILSETNDYFIYPVVNAQNIVCQNYPYLSNENTSEIQKQYYHSTKSLCENVLWPDLAKILDSTGDKLTGMIAPKLEYNTDSKILAESVDYYFRQTEKISGELGISGEQLEGSFLYEEKINEDSETLKKLLPDYTFTIFSPGSMPESVYKNYVGNQEKESVLSSIKTILLPKESKNTSVLSFYSQDILTMTSTINGFSHTDEEDLYLKSLETALGYSSITLDFTQVIYPSSGSKDWTKLSQNFSRYLKTYWEKFREVFDSVTVSETDTKVRQFLALSYQSYRQNDTITLSITNFYGNASFILNLSNEQIVTVSGGSFTEIESNKYLINASEKDIVIEVTATGAE